MWEMEAKFNLKWGVKYYEITYNSKLVAFFLNKVMADEYIENKNKEPSDGQVSNPISNSEEVRNP